jgi:hypothetical protein
MTENTFSLDIERLHTYCTAYPSYYSPFRTSNGSINETFENTFLILGKWIVVSTVKVHKKADISIVGSAKPPYLPRRLNTSRRGKSSLYVFQHTHDKLEFVRNWDKRESDAP